MELAVVDFGVDVFPFFLMNLLARYAPPTNATAAGIDAMEEDWVGVSDRVDPPIELPSGRRSIVCDVLPVPIPVGRRRVVALFLLLAGDFPPLRACLINVFVLTL
jgi:hypothetical protein